jgi:hypothetical protein
MISMKSIKSYLLLINPYSVLKNVPFQATFFIESLLSLVYKRTEEENDEKKCNRISVYILDKSGSMAGA